VFYLVNSLLKQRNKNYTTTLGTSKKIKRMKKKWHFIFFSLYKLDYKLHLLFNKINPILLIYKIPVIDRYYKKKGISLIERLNHVYSNKNFGFSVFSAFYIIHTFLCCILFTIIILLLLLFQIKIEFEPFWVVIIMIFAICLNYFLLLKTEQYKESFIEFETENSEKLKKYHVLNYVLIIISFIAFYYSLITYSEYYNSI